MANKMVDTNRFAMVPQTGVPRSAWSDRWSHKTTFSGNYLIPIYVEEILPGDSLSLRMSVFCRLATAIVPPMDNAWLESFFFFVPNRLTWSNWERFMGEMTSPSDTTAFLTPYVTVGANAADATVGALANYFGLPQPTNPETYIANALPFRAYNLIVFDWFRDQDIWTTVPTVNTGDGPDTISTTYSVLLRNKRPDYFTTARPFSVKPSQSSLAAQSNALTFQPGGDAFAWSYATTSAGFTPGVGAPVAGIGVTSQTVTGGATQVYETGGRTVDYPRYYSDAGADIRLRATPSPQSEYPDIRVMIQDIRTANMIQVFGERNARGGTRYAELTRAHFGVMSPDSRLQRPEYLGGGRVPVHINPVAQQSATSGTELLGELAGIGTISASGHGFSASFTEHGFVIGIVNVFADTSYQQGVHKMWSRRTLFEYYFPSWAHLSEQAILSKEIYADGTSADENVFGFQERWAEMRYRYNMITGAFNSNAAAPLDVWHFATDYSSRPTLNQTFVQMDAPFGRVLQVSAYATQQFLFDAQFNVKWVRAMPIYSIPALAGKGL